MVEQIVDTPGSGRIAERLADQWQVRRVPGPETRWLMASLMRAASDTDSDAAVITSAGCAGQLADVGTRLISGCAG